MKTQINLRKTKLRNILVVSLLTLLIGIEPISASESGEVIDIHVNQPYSTSMSLPFIEYNTCSVEYPLNPCNMKYGKAFIMDSANIVIYESEWSSELTPEVSLSPYSIPITFTPVKTGSYYLIGVILNQTYTYDDATQLWSMNETIESKEAYQLNARAASPTPTYPSYPVHNIISWIIDWLRIVFPNWTVN